VEVASGGFTLVREQLRLVKTGFFRTLVDAVKEKSEATARAIAVDEVVTSCHRQNLLFFTEVERHVAEADIGCVSENTSTDTEAGAANVNEGPEVPAKVKREEV
jgi:hypothetical protein